MCYYVGFQYEDSEESEIYIFHTISGKLKGIKNRFDNSNITVLYDNEESQFPILFVHSNEKKMNITYMDSGLISIIDILDAENNTERTRLFILMSCVHVVLKSLEIRGLN